MKHYRFVAVALVLAALPLMAAMLMGYTASDAVAASITAPDMFHQIARGWSGEHVMAFWPALIALRSDLDTLLKKAEKKIGEIKDDTAPDAARSIEAEHKTLLDEIEAKRAEIAAEEKLGDPATRGQDQNGQQQSRAEANRAADILDIGTRAGMDAPAIQDAIRNGTSLDAFRTRAFDFMVERQNGNRTDPARSRINHDERDVARAASIEALSYRIGSPVPQNGPSAAARSRMDDGLIHLAMDCLGERNYPRNARQIEELFERAAAHTTSDFPIILEGAINRTVEARYQLAQPTYRRISRQRNFRDFRPHTSIKLGDFPMLDKIAENGEIKYGTLTEGKETTSVLSYAKALSVSRQLMINDDLGAINEMLASYGATVALFEEITFYANALNAVLADGQTVFHSSHSNLAGSGAAIDVDSVALGRAAMSKQKSIDGNPLLANPPAMIVTGPDRITSAEKLIASITPATVATVNIFSGRLTPFDTAQISGNTWYLFADPQVGSNYRWGYLEGYEAPRVRIDNPFGRQGMAMSVEHDFGCGAVDFRYGYKNPGA
ncbi:hypothetical protein [Rhizobium sp. RU36D]|uniref:phage major capsid protein n=1 Tax=Rhizobium sp. RU36D TaxID=1907415 RepID=UPI0009D7B02E|nr:hypothetical protein [Rhizobium sp. RU36D]SMD18507.1 hypothetical protein SAMN05880593_13522 [Rhizobium sp. RU36D]